MLLQPSFLTAASHSFAVGVGWCQLPPRLEVGIRSENGGPASYLSYMRSIENKRAASGVSLYGLRYVRFPAYASAIASCLAVIFQQWQIQSTFYSTNHNDQTWQSTFTDIYLHSKTHTYTTVSCSNSAIIVYTACFKVSIYTFSSKMFSESQISKLL